MRATQGLLDLYAAYASEEACCREAWDQGEVKWLSLFDTDLLLLPKVLA